MVRSFINNMVGESKYCSRVIIKHFNKELFMVKKENKDYESSVKCWICDNSFVENNVKLRNHCNVTGQ